MRQLIKAKARLSHEKELMWQYVVHKGGYQMGKAQRNNKEF